MTPLNLMTLLSMPKGTDINFLELPNIFLQLGSKFITPLHNSKSNIDQNWEESIFSDKEFLFYKAPRLEQNLFHFESNL